MNIPPGPGRVAPSLPDRRGEAARGHRAAPRAGLPRIALALLGLAAATVTLAAAPHASAPPLRLGAADGFAADLRACQTAFGGRLDQRRRLEARQPRVAACLRQRGWNADGTPSLDRLLAPG